MKKNRKSKAEQKTHAAVAVSCLQRSNKVCTKGKQVVSLPAFPFLSSSSVDSGLVSCIILHTNRLTSEIITKKNKEVHILV